MHKKPGIKIIRFQFDVEIVKVELAISFNCQLSVVWKLGSHKVETGQKIDLLHGNAEFNENLQIISKIYYDETEKTFLDKKSQFTVILVTNKGNKIAGVSNVNFGDIVNKGLPDFDMNVRLERCPDKNAKISLKIRTSLLGEINDYEVMSQTTANVSKIDEPMIYDLSKPEIHELDEKKVSKPEIDSKNNNEHSSSKDIVDRLMDDIKGLRSEKQVLLQRIKEAESIAIEYQNKSTRLEQFIQNLDTEKFRMEDSLRKSNNEIESLKKEIISKVSSIESLKERELKCLVDQIKTQSSNSQIEIDDLNKRIRELEEGDEEWKIKFLELENQLNLNSSILKGSKNEATAVEAENTQLKGHLNELRDVIVHLKSEVERFEREDFDSKNKIESQESMINQLKNELNELNEKAAENEFEKNKVQKLMLEAVDYEMSHANTRISQFEDKIQTLETETNSFKEQIFELQSKNENFNLSNESKNLEIQKLKKINNDIQSKFEVSKNENKLINFELLHQIANSYLLDLQFNTLFQLVEHEKINIAKPIPDVISKENSEQNDEINNLIVDLSLKEIELNVISQITIKNEKFHKTQTEDLKNQLSELKADNQLNQNSSQYDNLIKLQAIEIDNLKSKTLELTEECEKEILKLKENFSEELLNLNMIISSLNEEKVSYNERLSLLQSEYAQLQKEKYTLESKITEFTDSNQNFQTELSNTNIKLESALEEIEIYSKNISERNNESKIALKTSQDEIKDLKLIINEQILELTELNEKIKQKDKECQENESKIISLKQDYSQKLETTNQSNFHFQNKITELENSKSDFDEILSRNKSLEKENNSKNKEISKLRNYCNSTMNLIQDLKFREQEFIEFSKKYEASIYNQISLVSSKLLKTDCRLSDLRNKLSSLFGFEVLKTEVAEFLDDSRNEIQMMGVDEIVTRFKEAKNYYRTCELEKEKAIQELRRVIHENESMKDEIHEKNGNLKSDEILEFKPKTGFKEDHCEMSSVSNSNLEIESEMLSSRIEHGQQELLKNKQILGDIINLLVDYGEAELLEKITAILSNK